MASGLEKSHSSGVEQMLGMEKVQQVMGKSVAGLNPRELLPLTKTQDKTVLSVYH